MTSIMYKSVIYILQYKRIKGGKHVGDGKMKWAKDDKNKKYVVLIVGIILVAICVTFLPHGNSKQTKPITTTIKQVATKEEESYETAIEKRLTSMLAKMQGVGSVSVMVTVHANEEKVLAEDTTANTQRTEEKDQAGGTRTTDIMQQTNDVVLQNGNTQSCPTLCDPMNRSTPGLPVHHQLPEFTQTQVHRVGDAIQPSHPLLSPSPPSPNPSYTS